MSDNACRRKLEVVLEIVKQMILGKSLTYSQPGNEPAKAFLFRKRVEKIDWRRIASVDVNRVASQIDIETLQEILTPVTFCDITSEIDTRYVDTNFIKLFQLAQLLIEYLLYSQDYLTSTITNLKEENEGLQKSITQLQDQLVQKSNRLTMVRRECHRRRLLLLAQQQLMDSGPQSYHRCLYCSKAFLNASFLAAHVHRRHPETELPTATKPVTEVGFVQTDPRPTIAANDGFQTQNNNTSAALEKDVRELLSHLRSQQFQGPPNVELPALDTQNTPYPPLVNTGTGRGDEAQRDWQATMREERRRELDLLRSTFEKELKEIQAQYTSTRQELYQLKLKKATSNLGELLDDDSDESQPKRGSLKRNPDPAVREQANVTPKFTESKAKPVSEDGVYTAPAVSKTDATMKTPNSEGPGNLIGFSTVAESVRTAERGKSLGGLRRQDSLISSCSSLNLPEHSLAPPRTQFRNMSLDRAFGARDYRNRGQFTDDENDNAESDVTAPAESHHQNLPPRGRPVSRERTHPSLARKGVEFHDYPDQTVAYYRHHRQTVERSMEIPHMKQNWTDEREIKHARARPRRTKHVRKRVRCTAVQVGQGHSTLAHQPRKRQKLFDSLDALGDPIFLKVKRPYSRSGSSNSGKSASPSTRWYLTRRSGLSKEIVIVRTDDEDFLTDSHGEEKSELTRSIHLMPTAIVDLDENNLRTETKKRPEMRKEIIAPAGLSSERLGPDLPQGKNRQYVQVLDEPTMVTDTKSSPCQPHTMSSPTVHPSDSRKHAEMQHSAQPLSVSRQSEDLTEESDEMEVSRVMGRALASSGTPTPIHSPNVNMTRHDRLLDQLQPDAETLRRLRHEIEQLLNEQLAAHNIGKDQTQLSTPQLNERLAKLKRERERLSQKYPDFMEIREALAQQVDRMANAALHSRSTNRLNASGSGKGAKNVQLGPSGLPPPAVHSPASIRKYGTIPLSSQRTDLHSPMGYSMPSLMGQGQSRAGQSGSSSLNSSLYKLNTSGLPEAKPRFQRSSPQLNFDNEYSEEPIHSPQQSETSIREVSRASPKKTAQSPKHPLKSPERKTRLDGGGSPSINFSPDHRVVTFGTKSDVNPNFVASSSDEWDSDSDDIKAPTESNREAGNQHKTAPRTGLDDRLTDDMDDDLDAVENYLNSEGRQRNANALRNPEQPVRLLSSHPADPKMGISLSTNVNTALKSDNALEDLDSDE
ncbi:unnamed protein product [Calicophoron daubneyi]|uniref:C2H2-type domain-containing protein n=1 Tax=Calicophoron daubneyi TaxID=300641 RepID=A0AAV2T703_CALDB